MRHLAIKLSFALLLLVVIALTLWGAAALYFDLPSTAWRLPSAVAYVLLAMGILLRSKATGTGLTLWTIPFLCVLVWWLSLKPSNYRSWQPDVAEVASAEIQGDAVTIHNLRNCDYRTEADYTPRWENRTVHLSKLRNLDLFITYWGSPWIAHPILSFDFGDEGHVAISIETRKEIGETYSALRGFFRAYELIYILSDERDVVRLRTNYRLHEEVYIYRTRASAEISRTIFLDYLRRTNHLRVHPEWYNALTNNCTNNISATAADAEGRAHPVDWRILLNGKADKMLYQRGDLAGDLPFPELKRQAHINSVAHTANQAPDFSRIIRRSRAGF